MSRRILITGAASGLGAALADAFEARGDRVLRTDVTGEFTLDIRSDDDWARAQGEAGLRRARAFEWAGAARVLRQAYADAIARRRQT